MPPVFSLRVIVGLCIETLFLLGPWISWLVRRACFMGVISYKTLEWSWQLDPDSPTVMTETETVRWESWVDVFSPMGRGWFHIGCVGMERLLVLCAWRPGGKSSLWLSLFIFQGVNDTSCPGPWEGQTQGCHEWLCTAHFRGCYCITLDQMPSWHYN